ncbi:hypothetical protein [Rhodoferax ferrireducens]|uniref:phage fiber-tail adaptor protein n=1 Tax=Rhodoferax ferrireducens TaxID=192843 RepID=UPI000E0D69DB|nr:hypothetical protein [Rhodoferax ferrireducens]
MATFKKDPNAVLDYTVDWTAYLLPMLDAIETVTWLPEAPLVVVSQSNTASTATVFVSGGVEDTTLGLTCRITTTGGRTDDRTISLKIVNR